MREYIVAYHEKKFPMVIPQVIHTIGFFKTAFSICVRLSLGQYPIAVARYIKKDLIEHYDDEGFYAYYREMYGD